MLADDLRLLPPQTSDWVTLDAARVRAFADAPESHLGATVAILEFAPQPAHVTE